MDDEFQLTYEDWAELLGLQAILTDLPSGYMTTDEARDLIDDNRNCYPNMPIDYIRACDGFYKIVEQTEAAIEEQNAYLDKFIEQVNEVLQSFLFDRSFTVDDPLYPSIPDFNIAPDFGYTFDSGHSLDSSDRSISYDLGFTPDFGFSGEPFSWNRKKLLSQSEREDLNEFVKLLENAVAVAHNLYKDWEAVVRITQDRLDDTIRKMKALEKALEELYELSPLDSPEIVFDEEYDYDEDFWECDYDPDDPALQPDFELD